MASSPLSNNIATLFEDVSVLSPHYIPSTLLFREDHIKEIAAILSPALDGKKPRNLFIYGKTGSGKTCVAKRVMEQFGGNNTAPVVYINCRIYNSRYRILQKLLKQFVPELEKSGFGLPFLYEKLVEVANCHRQLIAILDEIDMVKDLDDLVYTLTRANDEIKDGGVTIVGISNKLSLKDGLDPRSKSSLYESEMVFPPYTADQLQKILTQRAEKAFVKGVSFQSAVNLVAAITAQENGDARYALKLLYKAAEQADQRNAYEISDDDVEAARRKVEFDLMAETVATLPENHQIVLYAIASLSSAGSRYARLGGVDGTSLFSGEVYDEYERVCRALKKKPRSARWYREYLSDLEMLGLIITMPSSSGIRGHTTLIKPGQSAADMLKATKKNLFGN